MDLPDPLSQPVSIIHCSQEVYILYRHSAVVYRFLLAVLPLLIHVKGSTGVYNLWVGPYFSSSIVEKRKISYFGLALNLFQHLISPNQDDLF